MITGTWCSGTSASWGFGSTGKRASSCGENLFSRCGVRLGVYDGVPHGRARPISAELPEFLQRQNCGSPETVSGSPGPYGIHSHSHATRLASCETTSALVSVPSPEMVPRHGTTTLGTKVSNLRWGDGKVATCRMAFVCHHLYATRL